ncbi:hypothetical protein WJX84_004882 [Apatococcus fuscideae]|uniref:F-box domain-containing protein n=1 Tax=Apatococcus fuscideae TaxID=2026836 RepID=A0AAW1SKS8_9CHLO
MSKRAAESKAVLDLRDDILAKVFSYLRLPERLNIPQVCRDWERLGSGASLLWKDCRITREDFLDRPDLIKVLQWAV